MSLRTTPLPRVDRSDGEVAVGTGTVTQCVIRINDASGFRAIDGRSSLAWLMREFSRFGVADFRLLADQAVAGQIPDDLQTSMPRRVRITVSHMPVGKGSGGALLDVRNQLQDRFLLCDGDMLFDWNLANLLAAAATDDPAVIGRVARFDASTDINVGLFRKALTDHLRPVCCLETEILPDLAARGLLWATTETRPLGPDGHTLHPAPTQMSSDVGVAGGLAVPAGTRLRQADGVSRLRRNALFLDRDGVVNLDHGYVGTRDRFEWVDGALDAIRYATEAGWHVFIVTNQSGVARGLFSEDAVDDLMHWISDQAHLAGGTVDDIRVCPFHPDAAVAAYRQAHAWRKPLPGMLVDLIRAWELDPERAVMVGDQETDMRAAAAAGVVGYLFQGGDLRAFVQPILYRHAQTDIPSPNRPC